MSDAFPWSVLGIARTSDRKAIRKAYATQIKVLDIDADIEGYAQLRKARDLALKLALADQPPPHEGDEPDPASAGGTARENAPGEQDSALETAREAASPSWALAAPRIHAEPTFAGSVQSGIHRQSADAGRAAETETPFARSREVQADRGQGEPLPLAWPQGLGAPTLDGYGEIEAALGLIPGQSAFDRLEDILRSEDGPEHLDEPLRIVALRALGTIIADARAGTIERQEQIENWLAGLLADTCPRSLPLLETAAQAFSWEEEWHRFDARPTVRFLGARLRGERFRARVEQEDHRYHKAWRELNRTGPAGPFRALRASRADVHFLIEGIRANFPHLEEDLDPERVASWFRTVRWPPRFVWAIGFVLLMRIVIAGWPQVSPAFTLPDGSQLELSQSGDPEPQALANAIADAVTDSFGAGHDLAWLWKSDEDLARAILSQVRMQLQAGQDQDAINQAVARIVRRQVYLRGSRQEGEALEAHARLRLAQLRNALDNSPQACLEVFRKAVSPIGMSVPPALREDERAAAARLAADHDPDTPSGDGSTRFAVPGVLIGRIMSATGLDEESVRAALQGKGQADERCPVAIALLQSALDWDGDANARKAILQGL